MNKKGFTLVELLAVIVILAIVALVTTPIILNTINDARENGAKDKAWGTIEAVKLAYSEAQMKANFNANDTSVNYASGSLDETIGGQTVVISGDKPKSGTVSINPTTGVITATDLRFEGNGTYVCNGDNSNSANMTCTTPSS